MRQGRRAELARGGRGGLAAAIVAGLLVTLPATAHAAFGVQAKNWEAGTCNTETCTYASVEKDHSEAYTQSAGHPPFGITTFEVNSREVGLLKQSEPEGAVRRVRVDVPPGLAADPQATPQCTVEEFEAKETTEGKDNCETNPRYAGSRVGTNKAVIFATILGIDVDTEAAVFNLQQPPGTAQDFGIYFGEAKQRLFLIGHVSWHREKVLEERGIPSGDYHEWFEINNVPREGEIKGIKTGLVTLESKLIFFGTAGAGDYLTNPAACSSVETNYLEVESWEGQVSTASTTPPLGVEGCANDPFGPTLGVSPETAASDQPDGALTTVEEPQRAAATQVDTADIADAHVTLPEGLTLNPSAAHGLEACSPAQIAIGSEAPVACPAGSQVGEVTIESDLPTPLSGKVYLGDPGGGPITNPPYTIYLDAESNYGVAVRLEGLVSPDPETGRLEVTFLKNPQLTFSKLTLEAKGGEDATLANPLVCGGAPAQALFTPYTGLAAATAASTFVTSGCPSPLPFALSQSTSDAPAAAGAHGDTSYTFDLSRNDGQQYLSQVRTVLPAGLVGAIPAITLCGEPQAGAGTCPAASQIGTATVSAGAGPNPYTFSGPVFLTGPYAGAPYGLSVAVPAVAGPFNLGTVLTRATLDVEPYSGRVVATSTLPRIVGGVPLRLRNISVTVNRANFLYNPTSCGVLATESTLTSSFSAAQSLSSAFQVGGCNALAFKPSYSASTTGAKLTRPQGASIEVKLTQPAGQANIRELQMQLPKQLVARLSTLQKACTAAEFEDGPAPGACKPTAKVGEVLATTPVLPGRLTGSAYFVSHGAEAFPDLDLILHGDGVQVVLVGHTHIARSSVTTSTFEALPDVPVSSVSVKLPIGPNSALASEGRLCGAKLVAPTTIIAQSGAKITQPTRIAVSNCPIQLISHRVRGARLVVTVWAPEGGRLSVTAHGLRRVTVHVRKAGNVKISVPLSAALTRKHARGLRLRIGFTPRSGHNLSALKLALR
jgi:hypothetical protein